MSETTLTEQLLDECAKAGYRRVAIGMTHESIPDSVTFPFGSRRSVFAWPTGERQCVDHWPAIWGVCDRLGVGFGCGNSHQHQVRMDRLERGVYRLITRGKNRGQWVEVAR